MLIIASAGMLEVLAGRAIGKVEVKLLSGGLGIWGDFDLEDHGQHFAFGDRGVLHEPFALFGELKCGMSVTLIKKTWNHHEC